MKRRFVKKAVSVCLAVSVAMSLAACSGGQEEPASAEAVEVVEEPQVSEIEVKPAEEPEEAPAVSAEETIEEEAAPATAKDADLSKYIANTEVLKIQTGSAENSNLEMIPIRFAYASSQLEDESSSNIYDITNIYDGDLTTAFVEGADGDGIGEILKIEFDDMRSYELGKIRIYSGYQKDEKTFKKNSRPSKLAFYFPDGHRFVQEFDYGNESQGYFDIDLTKVFAGHVVANDCVISIVDAISGEKFDDCCISEIEFYSPKTPDSDVVLVSYETEYIDDGENCTITATKDGQQIWEYKASTDTVTELDGVGYVLTANGIVFVQDDWQIVALDENTGNEIWRSTEEYGFSESAGLYDVVTGNIFVTGYYGPNLIGFDKEGNILPCSAETENYWPCVIVPVIDEASQGTQVKAIEKVRIYFDGEMTIEEFEVA